MRVCGLMHTALERLAEALETDPGISVRDLDVLPEAERRLVLETWNATEAPFPEDRCVHELVEAQARRAPESVAVIMGARTLAYGELNGRANRLAHRLRSLGVRPDSRVAVRAERSLELVVGLLAVLKAGGAYVPLDPSWPAERLRHMLCDSGPVALLALGEPAGGPAGMPVLDLAQSFQDQPDSDPDPAAVGLTASHLAYVIYTSGSTGLPKGVLVEHRSLANLIHWHGDTFGVRAGTRSSGVSGVGFDAAAWEIWPALALGGTLLFPPAADAADPEALLAWWSGQDLDVSFLPTPMAEAALSRRSGSPQLRILLTGGDRLQRLPAEEPPFALVNNYGPTEASIVATSGRVSGAELPPIGRPIANTRVYILDSKGLPAPIGVAGELHIGGAGVARGYLNRPELTAERFLPDPFSARPRARLYKTGDMGRWLPDGSIEFLGRNDFQLKLRGFRIEPGEIEARLREQAGVREAVVVAREERLVAYLASDVELGAERLRAHLLRSLPPPMVPAAFVRMAALPLTANGKLDRAALPAPEGDAHARRAYEAPLGVAETMLAVLWSELLQVERIGRHDSFFELGGYSLLVMRLVALLRGRGCHLAVADVFAHPTLLALARKIEES